MSPSTGSRACTLCGRSFQADEVVPMLDCLVCAGCKPMALQRVQEGSPLLPEETPRLTFSAQNPEGKQVTDKVQAASAAAARAVLEHRGFRNVTLHEDDASLAGNRLFARDRKPGQKQPELSAKDHVRMARARTVWPLVRLMLRKTWVSLVLVAVLFALGWKLFAGLTLALIVLVFIWATLPLAAYQKLLHAVEEARWPDVARVVRRARLVNRVTPARIPEFELVFREAEVAAAGGRLEEALRMMAPFADAPKVERWMYCNRIATLYGIAKDTDDQMLWCERAVEAAPENFAVVADLALNTARKRHDPGKARELLERAGQLTSSDLIGYALPLCEGVIEYESGRYAEAVERLEEAEAILRPNLEAFFMPGFLNLSLTYRALALARLGDRETAGRLAEQVRPWLQAWRETELLNALEAELTPLARA